MGRVGSDAGEVRSSPRRRRAISRSIPCDLGALRSLRGDVDQVLDASDVSPDDRCSVLLVLDELVTNAIEHAAEAPIEVSVEDLSHGVAVSVSNRRSAHDPVLPPPEDWNLPPLFSTHGRGLPLVVAYSSDVRLDQSEDTTLIRAEIDLSDRAMPHRRR